MSDNINVQLDLDRLAQTIKNHQRKREREIEATEEAKTAKRAEDDSTKIEQIVVKLIQKIDHQTWTK